MPKGRNSFQRDNTHIGVKDPLLIDCLLDFLNTTALAMNDNIPVDVIYTDFKSAFETMPHETRLSVLPSMGVGLKLVNWIADFLRGSHFQVMITGLCYVSVI